MKIIVVNEFYDKFHTNTLYKEGMVLDFEESRAKNIIARGLGKAYVEPIPEPKKEEAPKPEPKAEEAEVKEEVVETPEVEEKVEDAPKDDATKPVDEAPTAEEEVEVENAKADEAETAAPAEEAKAEAEPANEEEEVKPKTRGNRNLRK